MRTWLVRAILTSGVAMLALAGTARAWEEPCRDKEAVLNGDYAFTVSGQIFTPSATISREGVALTHFDGKGKLTQVDFVLSSPLPAGAPKPPAEPTDTSTGFNNNETGTYTVNSDCTGTFEIDDPPATTATGATVPGAIIKVMFVLSDHGRSIHTIVFSLTPPGAPAPVPVLIRSEGHKLGTVES
jgi:hypothetical protein